MYSHVVTASTVRAAGTLLPAFAFKGANLIFMHKIYFDLLAFFESEMFLFHAQNGF